MHLDRNQKEAAGHFLGPCLVIAGPGAGKTTVITERIRVLTEERDVPGSGILVVTFTRAAAEEMEKRYVNLSGKGRVNFGTFHSVFFRILQERYGYTAEDILDENGKRRMLNKLRGTRTAAEDADAAEEVMKRYEAEKTHRGLVDFEDILIKTEKLLQTEPAVLDCWRNRFRFILVDEFQDINPLQYRILRLLAAPENNLFLVGDDDQSIYAFRKASPEIMLNLKKDYSALRTIYLTVNYRSGQRIVDTARQVISENKVRYRKDIRAGRREAGGFSLTVRKDATEEAAVVLRSIREKHKKGLPYHEMAVLFRTAYGMEDMMKALDSVKIPYVLTDRVPNLFRMPVMKPVFSYINYAEGDRSRENFVRMMNVPNRGIFRADLTDDPVDLESLKMYYRASNRKEMPYRLERLEKALQLLKIIGRPLAMISYIRRGLRYDEYVIREEKAHLRDPKDALAALDFLQESAREFETVQAWYAYISDYTRALEKSARADGRKAEGVVLSTIHRAKGLEYDTVFIMDVNERILPHERSLSEKKDIEEERRILYVGMTRAKNDLHLLYVRERFEKPMEKSRFLHGFSDEKTDESQK